MRVVTKIILHCSANDWPFQTAKWIDKIHKKRDFDKIGYHYFIRKRGLLERGRGLDEVGAHVKGHNHDSIGICLAGLKEFNGEQFESLTVLLLLLKRIYPDAKLYGHNEFDPNKTCPVYNIEEFKEIWNTVTLSTRRKENEHI